MIHPKTYIKFINDTVGYGVFASEFIPEGTIVYVKDSLEIGISPEDFDKHSKEMKVAIEKYSYIDQNGYRIVSWDFAKYVNHCCECNTISTGYGFEMAIKDIQANEQITDEYGIFNLTENMQVDCSLSNCRKVLKSTDFENYYDVWDEKIKKSIAKIFKVDQALFPLLDKHTVQELIDLKKSMRNYKSVYSLKFKPELNPRLSIAK